MNNACCVREYRTKLEVDCVSAGLRPLERALALPAGARNVLEVEERKGGLTEVVK